MGKYIFVLSATALFISISSASANDSSAGFDNYGIVFKKTEDIEMRSEYLYISPSKIDVTYEFFNKTSEPITETIAFSLPEIEANYDSDVDYPVDDFTTTVNGQIITLELEERAFLDGKEITNLLKTLGVQLNPTDIDESKIDPSIVEELKSIEMLSCYTCKGDYTGNWSYRRTYYREQTFPPQEVVRVQHQYTPSKSSSVPGNMFDFPCPDKDTKAILRSAAKNIYLNNQIDYILTTGGNWAGGVIGDFRLVVDKEKEENFVNFCGDGVKKISPTQFEMHKKNFIPKRDLSILFLKFYGKYSDFNLD